MAYTIKKDALVAKEWLDVGMYVSVDPSINPSVHQLAVLFLNPFSFQPAALFIRISAKGRLKISVIAHTVLEVSDSLYASRGS